MRRSALTAVSACILAASLPGCLPERNDYSGFVAIDPAGWAYGDTIELVPELTDSAAVGRIAVAVRHTDGYLYRNLWLEVTTPLGDTVLADTINVSLADIYGKWHGTGVGVSYIADDTLPGSYCLTRGRPVTLRHIMRADTLHDIEQIGLIFIPD
ncbi:MAG: gliding motility lipoprotein GldH [Bacteroidales bacterium]|nr:gliding motility lipoprotein GldH [Bacteroidales bacterium]